MKVSNDKLHPGRAAAVTMALALGASLFPGTTLMAVTQGMLGMTSSASVAIKVTIPPRVQIARLDDIVINISDPERDTKYVEPLCVRGTGASGFKITAHGSGAGGAFELAHATTNESLGYQIGFRGQRQGDGSDVLNPGVSAGTYKIMSKQPACGGTDNAALEIKLSANDMRTLEGGAYTGTLTLTVAAE